MSVATAGAAVSTQQHQPTQEQIRLAQLIDDKKHDQPELQAIIRKVLDVVENSSQEDAVLALFDCDYDCEKAVALLIEKGHDVASEWRTATNHKLTKKQQQQKVATPKNGHEELNENGQQRGHNTPTSRGKSRGGRSRVQQNGGDSHNANNQQQQANDTDISQQRQRGGNSAYRGRGRSGGRGGFRGTDRNYQQPQQQEQTQDSNADTSSPSDTNRRSKGPVTTSKQQPQQDQFDVGNWNGETVIYSRTTNDDEQPTKPNDSSNVQNGQSNTTNPEKSKPDFDPIEAARQIKNVIGIGLASKPSTSDQQQKPKPTGQMLNTKVTPPPVPRIPQQPVIFSDRFNGGVNKIDVQFGNLGESYDDSASSAFYQPTQSIPSNKIPQRPTAQPVHISPATRPSEQPVMNQQQQQQRILLAQVQQPSMNIKPVVTPQYAVHQQQHQIPTPNMLIQSLLYQHQQQPESVTLDTSYDPTPFSLPSMEFNSPYFMAAPMNQPPPQQQPAPARYLVSQPLPPQQTSAKNVQTLPASASSTATKKAPAVPPGMFPPTAAGQPLTPAAFSAAYGVQQQTGGPTYSTPYDNEHIFSNAFMPLTNAQQAQSSSAGYGSVTPPVQQQNQQQQANNNNDNKAMNFRAPPITEDLMLLQQYQQFTQQQSNSQQHGQQVATHSPGLVNYFVSHAPSGSSYSTGPPIMYTPAATAMAQQQGPKQQGQQYNQNNSSTNMAGNDDYYGRVSSASTRDGQYTYVTATQPQHVPPQSSGQQQGVNKQQQQQQQQQRPSSNVYNNQQGQQRPFQ